MFVFNTVHPGDLDEEIDPDFLSPRLIVRSVKKTLTLQPGVGWKFSWLHVTAVLSLRLSFIYTYIFALLVVQFIHCTRLGSEQIRTCLGRLISSWRKKRKIFFFTNTRVYVTCPVSAISVRSVLTLVMSCGLPSFLFISVILGPYHRNTVARTDKRFCRVILMCEYLVGRLCIDNDRLNTIFKVCVLMWCILCEIEQRWRLDRSPWSYLYHLRSSDHSVVIFRMSCLGPPAVLNSWTHLFCRRTSDKFALFVHRRKSETSFGSFPVEPQSKCVYFQENNKRQGSEAQGQGKENVTLKLWWVQKPMKV